MVVNNILGRARAILLAAFAIAAPVVGRETETPVLAETVSGGEDVVQIDTKEEEKEE